MTLIVIVSSLIVIVRLLTFENKHGKRKLSYGMCAYTICVTMLTQVIHSDHATMFQAFITSLLAVGVIYHEGNVSHLIKGVKKCVKNSLNL